MGIREVMTSAVKTLTSKWKSFLIAPLEMHATMFVIALPARFYATRAVTYADAEQLQNRLYHEHDIELPVKPVQGLLGCRCSVHIYNELHEYERLGDIINDIANELDQ